MRIRSHGGEWLRQSTPRFVLLPVRVVTKAGSHTVFLSRIRDNLYAD
jgi:hypothetical protein